MKNILKKIIATILNHRKREIIATNIRLRNAGISDIYLS